MFEPLLRWIALNSGALYLKRSATGSLSKKLESIEHALSFNQDQRHKIGQLLDEKLLALDIGARGGIEPHLVRYQNQFQFALVEPEPEESARLSQGGYVVIDKLLGREQGTKNLYVTKSPGSSSTFRPGGSLLPYYAGDTTRFDVVKTVELPVTTVDEICADLGQFDYIKLDVQGGELDIFLGMKKCRPFMIKTEIMYGPLYKGQPLFQELLGLLYDYGYLLTYHTTRQSLPPPQKNVRSSMGVATTGDAWFVPDWTRPVGLKIIKRDSLKWAAVLLIHGYEDLVRYVLDTCEIPNKDRILNAL